MVTVRSTPGRRGTRAVLVVCEVGHGVARQVPVRVAPVAPDSPVVAVVVGDGLRVEARLHRPGSPPLPCSNSFPVAPPPTPPPPVVSGTVQCRRDIDKRVDTYPIFIWERGSPVLLNLLYQNLSITKRKPSTVMGGSILSL